MSRGQLASPSVGIVAMHVHAKGDAARPFHMKRAEFIKSDEAPFPDIASLIRATC
jgi:hypothetical protein